MTTPGTRSRMRASNERKNVPSRPRFIRRRSLSEQCCNGMSRYFTTFGSSAMASMSASGKSRG